MIICISTLWQIICNFLCHSLNWCAGGMKNCTFVHSLASRCTSVDSDCSLFWYTQGTRWSHSNEVQLTHAWINAVDTWREEKTHSTLSSCVNGFIVISLEAIHSHALIHTSGSLAKAYKCRCSHWDLGTKLVSNEQKTRRNTVTIEWQTRKKFAAKWRRRRNECERTAKERKRNTGCSVVNRSIFIVWLTMDFAASVCLALRA